MRIYLSGKITGDKNYIEKFKIFEEGLRELYPDAVIINPVIIGKRVEKHNKNPEWIDYMKPCIEKLRTCTHIFMLPDWRESKGAIYEHATAKSLGLKVLVYGNIIN